MCVVKCVGRRIITGMRTALALRTPVFMEQCAARPVLGAMTLKTDLLGQMRYEWQHVGHTRRSRTAMTSLSERHPNLRLDGLIDLCDIVTLLERRGGALLQTLIPGIVSVARQLGFGEGIVDEPSETLGVALGLASELLTDWAGQSRQYAAPDILSALRGRLRRWLLKEKAAQRVVSNYDQRDEPAMESSPLLARLHSFRGSQYDRIARLTYARVYEGRSLREIAADDHSAPSSLQKELQHFAVRFLI